MPEKQTTFFTINCAENLESPNQCCGSIQINHYDEHDNTAPRLDAIPTTR
jgi:hypothetical protein